MRYIRFLKTPRIVKEKNQPSANVYCLITITSDLGDSFLPSDLTLSAELIEDTSTLGITNETNNIIIWKTIKWSEGMRSLPVTLPLSRSYKEKGPLLVRIGAEPKSQYDEFERLLEDDTSGVVSAWSAPFNFIGSLEAVRTVERRFQVGITLARLVPGVDVYLTDLPEAQEIVTSNVNLARPKLDASIAFHELDWERTVSKTMFKQGVDLIVAADCTYNADSSPALVNTIRQVATLSPTVTVAIAMKKRHSSEDVFFDLMSEANFQTIDTIGFPLPGDERAGEERVELYIYEYSGASTRSA
ncbi:hypothetical protein N0V90_003070 [Kalmusia sp. IMI 367209]|nr:hypothetical protein N0V90_003070 [Kalmusia sp. IMI 367209]